MEATGGLGANQHWTTVCTQAHALKRSISDIIALTVCLVIHPASSLFLFLDNAQESRKRDGCAAGLDAMNHGEELLARYTLAESL